MTWVTSIVSIDHFKFYDVKVVAQKTNKNISEIFLDFLYKNVYNKYRSAELKKSLVCVGNFFFRVLFLSKTRLLKSSGRVLPFSNFKEAL